MKDIKLLIVDDSKLIREELKSMIIRKTACTDILEADDIKSGLKIIHETRPNILIVDLSLPDGTGFEIITVAKDILPDSLIIILTNHPFKRFEKKAIELGANYFFDKSFDILKVMDIITSLLNSSD